MSTTTDALLEIRSMLGDDILHSLAEFDGSATILVPNETTNYDLTQPFEGPQIIQFRDERLETFPTRTWWELNATSTSIRHTDTDKRIGRRDWNMVLVGKRRCQVNVGGNWISDAEFFALLIRAARQGQNTESQTDERIISSLVQRGLAFNGIMPMYMQHLGADEDRFNNEIVPLFLDMGANDNTSNIRQGTQGTGRSTTAKSLRLEGEGAKVLSFEVGVADRTKSANGNGFISFLDATYTTVAAIVEADRTIRQSNAVLADPNSSEIERATASNRKAFTVSYWGSGSQRNRRPFHNWGGTTRAVNEEGNVVYYPTSVPCGRMVIADHHGREHAINVWMRNNANPTDASADTTTPTNEDGSFVPVIDFDSTEGVF